MLLCKVPYDDRNFLYKIFSTSFYTVLLESAGYNPLILTNLIHVTYGIHEIRAPSAGIRAAKNAYANLYTNLRAQRVREGKNSDHSRYFTYTM